MKILPFITRIFKSKTVKTVKVFTEKAEPNVAHVTKSTVPIASRPVQAISQSASQVAKEENPFLEYIYKMYERDGVSRETVKRIVLDGERQRFYRYVGQEELDKLLSGERITSNRPCHGGSITDVTSNPYYANIPTIGKYRLSFKDKPEFSPYPLGTSSNSRIIEHDLKESEYYLCGGYDISDIEKIEQYMGGTTFRNLDLLW